MPSGNCAGCRQFSVNLDNVTGYCPQCQMKRAASVAPAPATPAPDHRADELKKWVTAEIKIASRMGGSCGGCQFSVMSDHLRCRRMPPVNVAGSRWEFPAVLPFSSCGEFATRHGESAEEGYSFGDLAEDKADAQQQLTAAGMGIAAGAVAADLAGDAAAIAGYLWYVDQVQDMYSGALGNTEDSGNFLEELFNIF